MKRLNVTIQCTSLYNSAIEVPDNLSLEEAIEYARKNVKEIPLGTLEWLDGSDEVIGENCCFDCTVVPIMEHWYKAIPITIIRSRLSENMHWADTIYLLLRKDEAVHTQEDALKLLRAHIGKYLTSREGWSSVINASMDYNWGDFIMNLPLERYGIIWELPNRKMAKYEPIITVSVDQDEQIAPEEIHAQLFLYSKEGSLLTAPNSVIVNFRNGELTIPDDHDTPALRFALEACVRGEVRLPNGEKERGPDTVLPLDPQERFMR